MGIAVGAIDRQGFVRVGGFDAAALGERTGAEWHMLHFLLAHKSPLVKATAFALYCCCTHGESFVDTLKCRCGMSGLLSVLHACVSKSAVVVPVTNWLMVLVATRHAAYHYVIGMQVDANLLSVKPHVNWWEKCRLLQVLAPLYEVRLLPDVPQWQYYWSSASVLCLKVL